MQCGSKAMYIMPGLDLTLQILGDYPLVCNACINACKLRSTPHLYVVQDMLKLSDDQIQDLMFVRRVTYLKNHILSCQREAVAAKILEDSPTPVVNVNKLSVSAIQLKQQALDKHDVVQRAKWAIHCGVSLDSVNCLGCFGLQTPHSFGPMYTCESQTCYERSASTSVLWPQMLPAWPLW